MTVRYLVRIASLCAVLLVSSPLYAYAQVTSGGRAGDILANIHGSLDSFPSLLSMAAYILGLLFATEGIFKFKDHVDESSSGKNVTPLSVPVKKFLAGGMLLSLPYMSRAVQGSVSGDNLSSISFGRMHDCGSCDGADRMIFDFVTNITGPATALLTVFAYIAAITLLILGITRLTKTAQEGPRGPAGLGTLMTFIVSGALFSFGEMIGTLSNSLFRTSESSIFANIGGNIMDEASAARVAPIIDSVMVFVALVGMIAFMRGLFVLKAFADGHQQSSVMQAVTFLIGGTIAINLGHFITALQNTVGLNAGTGNAITF